MTPLTPSERAAIAAYTGPVTICPPHTFTEGMFFASGQWHREDGETRYTKVHNKAKARGKATTNHIHGMMNQGLTVTEISKEMGMSRSAVAVHVRRIQDDAT